MTKQNKTKQNKNNKNNNNNNKNHNNNNNKTNKQTNKKTGVHASHLQKTQFHTSETFNCVALMSSNYVRAVTDFLKAPLPWLSQFLIACFISITNMFVRRNLSLIVTF